MLLRPIAVAAPPAVNLSLQQQRIPSFATENSARSQAAASSASSAWVWTSGASERPVAQVRPQALDMGVAASKWCMAKQPENVRRQRPAKVIPLPQCQLGLFQPVAHHPDRSQSRSGADLALNVLRYSAGQLGHKPIQQQRHQPLTRLPRLWVPLPRRRC